MAKCSPRAQQLYFKIMFGPSSASSPPKPDGFSSDDSDSETEKPHQPKTKASARSKPGARKGAKPRPHHHQFDAGDLVIICKQKKGKVDTSNPPVAGISTTSGGKVVWDTLPPKAHDTPDNTLRLIVPGMGTQMCSLGMYDGKVVASILPPKDVFETQGLTKHPDYVKPEVPEDACETMEGFLDVAAKLISADTTPASVFTYGFNILEHLAVFKGKGWRHLFEPKDEAEAEALLKVYMTYKVLPATIDGSEIIKHLICKPAEQAPARSRQAAPKTAKPFVMFKTSAVPMMGLVFKPTSLARQLDETSIGGIVHVPLTPGGEPIFEPSKVEDFRKAVDEIRAKEGGVVELKYDVVDANCKWNYCFEPGGTQSFVIDGTRFDNMKCSVVKMFDYPSDVLEVINVVKKRKAANDDDGNAASPKKAHKA